MRSPHILLVLAFLAVLPGLVAGQPTSSTDVSAILGPSDDLFVVPRLTGPIALDGRVDEAAWEAIAPLPLVTHWPEFGNEPSEPTEIRLAYDDDYVYLSCRCYAPPENVFAASFQRDLWTLGTDYLAIALDTFNDNENALYFLSSPTGSRTDAAISGDAESSPDRSWDTFWDAEATITDAGWFAELRIPFSSLRYQAEDGRVVMGMSTFRYLGRKNEMDLFPAIPPNWGFDSATKPSRLQKIVFEGIPSHRPIYMTPYALGGLGQTFELDDAETAYLRTDDRVTELGADLKVGLTDNLTLDLTLNTDFAQVEADDQQVNLTRFSLFFPEKRRFFLERASIFDFAFGGSDQLFYSRQIGLNDGEAVRLLGGGRLVGRVGSWDVGALNMQTARRTVGPSSEDQLPSENFGVFRLQRQVFNPNSTLGGIVTSRVGDDGTYNMAVGLDTDVRVFGDSYFSVNWAQTIDDATADGMDLQDLTRVAAFFERRAYTGFAYKVGFGRAGQAYRPDLGFQSREDFTAFGGRVSQGWGASERSPFARHQIKGGATTFLRNEGGTAETVEGSVSWEGQFTSGAFFNLGIDITYDDLLEGFELSDDTEVLPGSYTFVAANAGYNMAQGGALSAEFETGAGTFYDGWQATAGIDPKWIVSKHLELTGGYQLNRIAFPDRNRTFTAHIARFRALAALNTRLSLAAFLQYNSAANAGVANIRFRYNPREGTDFYLVLNTGFNTDRTRETPMLPFTSQRALLAKYTYTLVL